MLLKSIWEFVIVFRVTFFVTPVMISTRNLFYFFNYRCYYHECSSMIAFTTSKSYQPCFPRLSGVLPAGKSDHIQCTGKKRYWNSKLMDFFLIYIDSGLTHFWFWGQHCWPHFFTSGSPLQLQENIENWGSIHSHQLTGGIADSPFEAFETERSSNQYQSV